MERKAFLFTSAGLLMTACGRHSTAASAYQSIDDSYEPLRSAFNRDADKVRILMLVSPT